MYNPTDRADFLINSVNQTHKNKNIDVHKYLKLKFLFEKGNILIKIFTIHMTGK